MLQFSHGMRITDRYINMAASQKTVFLFFPSLMSPDAVMDHRIHATKRYQIDEEQ